MTGSTSFIINAPIVQQITQLFGECPEFNPTNFVLHTPINTSLSQVFYNCIKFNPVQFRINTTNVYNFDSLFYGCASFNPTSSTFYLDTRKGRNFKDMFNGCRKFNPSNINFNTSNATTMQGMFMNCRLFNVAKLNLITDNVTNMSYMFCYSSSFNSDLSSFNTSKVTAMSNMFNGCYTFNQDLSTFNTSNVTAMDYMFYVCRNYSPDRFTFDMSAVETTNTMFYACSLFNPTEFIITAPNLVDLGSMFQYCQNFNPAAFEINDTAVNNVTSMFQTASSFNPAVLVINTSLVTSFYQMFAQCSNFNPSTLALDTSNGITFQSMFEDCTKFNPASLPFNTAKATKMTNMFAYCSDFFTDLTTNRDIWNMENVLTTQYMFLGLNQVTSSVGSWNIHPNLNMVGMFKFCSNAVLNLNNWTITNQRTFTMFQYTTNFNVNWTNQVISNIFGRSAGMFVNSINFSGDLSNWTVTTDNNFRFFYGTTDFTAKVSNWVVIGDITEFCFESVNFNQVYIGLDTWNTSQVTSFTFPFRFSVNCSTSGLENWNSSIMTDLSYLFSFLDDDQCGFASSWDVSQVTTLDYLFETGNSRVFTADLSAWDTSNVTSMKHAFERVSTFEGVGLENWNLSSLTDISGFFANTLNFTYSNAKNLNISHVQIAEDLFTDSVGFQEDLTAWNDKLLNITSLARMFNGCDDTFNAGGLDTWTNLPNLTSVSGMFRLTNNFGYNKINNLILNSKVEDMSYLFSLSRSLSCDLTNWANRLESVSSFRGIFASPGGYQDENYNDITLTNFNAIGPDTWQTSNVKDYSYAFEGARLLILPCVVNWDTSGAENFSHMFEASTNFENDLSNWNVENVTDFSYIFKKINTLSQASGISSWNTTSLRTLEGALFSAFEFSADISRWTVLSCENIDYMFTGPDPNNYGTPEPPYLGFTSDVGTWSLPNVKTAKYTFSNSIYYGTGCQNWFAEPNKLEDITGIFSNNKYPVNFSYKVTFFGDWNLGKLAKADYFLADSSGVSITFPSGVPTQSLQSLEGALQGLNQSTTSPACILTNFEKINTENVTNMSRLFQSAKLNPEFCLAWSYKNVQSLDFFANRSLMNFDVSPIVSQLQNALTLAFAFSSCPDFQGTGMSALMAPNCTNFRLMLANSPSINIASSNLQYVQVPQEASSSILSIFLSTDLQGVDSALPKVQGMSL